MLSFFRKILLVICVSVLIWVWADQALTREITVPATIAVDKSTDPQFWVSFDNQRTVAVRLRVSGPASKIDTLDKRLKEGSFRLEFFVNPADEKIISPGTHSLQLSGLIQKNRIITDLGLRVEMVEPDTVNVSIVQLANQKLTVQILADNQLPLKDATVEPSTIEMLVRKDWGGDMLKATVVLTQQEIEQARTAGIWRKPFVELAPGITKTADTQVKISLPSTKQRLKDFVIDTVNIGYVFSPNLAGKYRVELSNQNQVLGPIKIQATDEAAIAYKNTPFKVILNISDDDIKPAGELSRNVVFNLPQEYVQKGEINIAEPDRMARFKLVPLETSEKPATAPL